MTPQNSGIRSLSRRFGVALVVIGCLLVVEYIGIRQVLVQQPTHAEMINRAGRQRMLSQRIAMYARRLVDYPDDATASQELSRSLEMMADSHAYLQGKVADLPSNFQQLFKQPPENLERRVETFLHAAREVLSDPSVASDALAILERDAEDQLLQVLETLVHDLEEYSTHYSEWLEFLERIVMLGMLSVMVAVYLFVFWPAIRQVDREQSRLQASEARFRSLSDALPVMIIQVDQYLRYRFVNTTYEKLLGRTRDQLLGQPISEILGDTHAEIHQPHFEAALRGQTSTSDVTMVFQGEKYQFQVTYFPHRDMGQQTSGLIVLAVDISERKQREIELREAKEKAEEAKQMMESFLANISHEIRTPLNAVVGFSQLLAQKKISEEVDRYIQAIRVSARSLLQLINDLLDISKIQANQMPVQHKPVELSQLIDDIRSIFSLQAEARGLYLLVKLEDNERQPLLDEGLLRQILLNLLGNALKFTEQGGITVRARLMPQDDTERATLDIEVTDTGPGIEEHVQALIFEPFRQRDGDNTRYGGTGLGLSISRRLSELMGGTLMLESQLGVGSTFRVRIPDVEINPQSQPGQPATQLQPALSIRFSPATVLVVDDDPSSCKLAAHSLREAGLRVEIAENGQEGLERVQALHPALILLDMRMPVMDGYTLLTRLKQNPALAGIPVIAYTAFDLQEHHQKTAEMCDGLINKPLDNTLLLRTLARFLPQLDAPLLQISSTTEQGELLTFNLTPEVHGAIQQQLSLTQGNKSSSRLLELAGTLCHLGDAYGPAELVTLGDDLRAAVETNRIGRIVQILNQLAQLQAAGSES